MLKQAWRTWRLFSLALMDFQSRIILTLFYLIVAAPFGLGLRFFRDPLHLRGFQQASGWPEGIDPPATLKEAQRQF